MIEIDLWALIVAMGIPSAVTGFCFWLIQCKIQRRDKEREEKEARERAEHQRRETEKEKAREDLEVYLVKSINASITLGVATAKAVQRIPDAHCNGDMTKALEFVSDTRKDYREFLMRQGIHAIYED